MYESNGNEQLVEYMDCQSSEPFDMDDTHLQNSARVPSGPHTCLRVLIAHERLARQVLLANPTGKQPRYLPRTRWCDYISDLAWSRFGVESIELCEISVDRDVFRALAVLHQPQHC